MFTNYLDFTQESVFYFLMIPCIIIYYMKLRFKDFGLQKGNIKFSLIFTGAGAVLAILTTYLATTFFPDVTQYYSNYDFTISFVISTIIYMLGWEFLFRGYLLFGLKDKFGFWGANIIQTILFFLTHIGKPGIELYSTLFTGLLFGYLTYKSKSVIAMIIIHSTIFISVVYFATI